MCVGHKWRLVTHDRHDYAGPLCFVVCLNTDFAAVLLGFGKLFSHGFTAYLSHQAVCDELRNRIWWEWIIIFAELDNLAHWLGMPVSESSANHWSLIGYCRNEIISSPHLLVLFLEVLLNIGVMNVRQLADARRPDEKRQDVLPADPALILLVSYDVPLASTRYHLLVADVP